MLNTKNISSSKNLLLIIFFISTFNLILSAHKASLRADTTKPIVLGKVNYTGCRVIIYDNDYAWRENDELTGCKTVTFGGGHTDQPFFDKNNKPLSFFMLKYHF